MIITKRRDTRDALYNPSIAKYIPQVFARSRRFYSPKYDVMATSDGQDFRSALYWNPDLISDGLKGVPFSFFTSDLKGDFRVIVEGIDKKGNLGRNSFRFKIE